MKNITLIALACLGVAVVDAPRFAPEDKSSVEKTFRSEVQFAATEFTMSMDGQELPAGDVVLKFEEVTKLVFTDRYVKSKDGRPIELDRTYDELAQTKKDTQKMPGQGQEVVEEKTLESALETKTVRFSWDPKTESYDTKFAGEDGDAALLVDLAEDTDYRALLPKVGAKVGDTWKLEGKDFRHLLDVGGNLHFVPSGKDEAEEKDDFSKQIDENLSGDAVVEFTEIREKDGLRLAVIEFKAQFKSHAEMEKETMHADVVLEPEGELLWDLTANRMHSLEFDGKVSIGIKGDQKIGEGSETVRMLHIEIQMEGTLSLDAKSKAL